MSIVVIHFVQVSMPIQKEEASGTMSRTRGSICVEDRVRCVTQQERECELQSKFCAFNFKEAKRLESYILASNN